MRKNKEKKRTTSGKTWKNKNNQEQKKLNKNRTKSGKKNQETERKNQENKGEIKETNMEKGGGTK